MRVASTPLSRIHRTISNPKLNLTHTKEGGVDTPVTNTSDMIACEHMSAFQSENYLYKYTTRNPKPGLGSRVHTHVINVSAFQSKTHLFKYTALNPKP